MLGFSKVVAIDGPSGSGKSTVALRISQVLQILYVDTGAMFRALGYYFHKKGISFNHEESVAEALKEIHFQYGKSPDCLVEINGENLTAPIREHFVSDLASRISKISPIRTFLLEVQREIAQEKVCVMEGRDIGTVIFPRAFCKIFLTASLDVRAERRFRELQARGDKEYFLEDIRRDMKARDEQDSNRALAPLRPAEDACYFDSSGFNTEEVTSQLCDHIRRRAREVGLEL